MKVFIKVLPLIIAVVVSCTPSGKWYVGDWEYDGPELGWTPSSFSITEDNRFIQQEGWNEPLDTPKDNIYYLQNSDGVYVRLDPSTKSAWVGDIDGETGPFHKMTIKPADSNTSGSGSDSAWKSAFDGNGFLVLKSDDMFGGIGGISNIYIVMKGYGKDYKHGMFKVDKPARDYYGLFEMFDDVILFYDLRDEVELRDDRYNNFYASHSKLNQQFFTWEGSSIIKVKGIITGLNSVESFSQIKGSEAQQYAREGIINY